MGQQHVWTAGSYQQSCYCPSAGQGALQGVWGGAIAGQLSVLQSLVTDWQWWWSWWGAVGLCVAALRWPAGLGRVRRPEPLPPAGWRGLRAARPALLRSAAGAESRSRSKVTQQIGKLHCQAHRLTLLLRGLCERPIVAVFLWWHSHFCLYFRAFDYSASGHDTISVLQFV